MSDHAVVTRTDHGLILLIVFRYLDTESETTMKLESFLLAAFIACLASLLQAQTKSLEVLVVDAKDQPVFNADIEVRDWTVRLAPPLSNFLKILSPDGKPVLVQRLLDLIVQANFPSPNHFSITSLLVP